MNGRGYLFFCGAVTVGVIGLLASSAAHAEDMPCTEEIRVFCADVQPGGGRILQCLKTNEAKLSPACVKRIEDLLAALSGPVGAACREDWAALCYHPRASTDRQAMLQCLEANQANVSAGCQKAMQGVKDTKRGRGERLR
jgi:hypothetical protein